MPGITFAPWDIPLERRLQTAAVLYYATSFLFFGFGGIILSLIVLFFTDYYYIIILYYTWLWFDHYQPHRGGRRSKWMRNWKMWSYLRDYFPVRLIKTTELDPKKNYICGYHPHGIFCVGAFTSFATDAAGFPNLFPKMTPYLLTLSGQFFFPFHREFILSTGACAVSKESISWLLNYEGTGNLVIIVIGGALEALDAHPGMAKLTIRKRKGFVRLAIKEGASLLPIYSFGENDIYGQLSNPEGSLLRTFQKLLTHFLGFSLPLIQGRGVFQYSFGYLPFRHPVDVVVGKPIDVKKNPNPSEDEVDHYHQLYMEGLRQLFNDQKLNYEQYKDRTLQLT